MKINKKNNDNNIDDMTVKYKWNSEWTKKKQYAKGLSYK
jgi:hypothetical protein